MSKMMMVSGGPATWSPERTAALEDIHSAAQRRLSRAATDLSRKATVTLEILSDEEASTLQVLEAEIDLGLRSFVAAGRALLSIHDARLYRASHATFEAYCAERWGITDRRARQLITATKLREDMRPLLTDGASIDAATERALRPLSALDPADAAAAWEIATELAGGEVPGRAETEEAVTKVKGTPAVLHSSKSSEFYTPKKFRKAILGALQVARKVDLDPCADPGRTFPAKQHFTAEDDAFKQEWRGETLYFNPAWAERQAPVWAEKFRAEMDAHHFLRAVSLLPGRIETQWLQKVMRPDVLCLVTGRITFVGADDPAGFPVVFGGHGIAIDVFAAAFEQHGEIWVPHKAKRRRSS